MFCKRLITKRILKQFQQVTLELIETIKIAIPTTVDHGPVEAYRCADPQDERSRAEGNTFVIRTLSKMAATSL
jgi:hypothetical protein